MNFIFQHSIYFIHGFRIPCHFVQMLIEVTQPKRRKENRVKNIYHMNGSRTIGFHFYFLFHISFYQRGTEIKLNESEEHTTVVSESV